MLRKSISNKRSQLIAAQAEATATMRKQQADSDDAPRKKAKTQVYPLVSVYSFALTSFKETQIFCRVG